jgi:hypothetical protein
VRQGLKRVRPLSLTVLASFSLAYPTTAYGPSRIRQSRARIEQDHFLGSLKRTMEEFQETAIAKVHNLYGARSESDGCAPTNDAGERSQFQIGIRQSIRKPDSSRGSDATAGMCWQRKTDTSRFALREQSSIRTTVEQPVNEASSCWTLQDGRQNRARDSTWKVHVRELKHLQHSSDFPVTR